MGFCFVCDIETYERRAQGEVPAVLQLLQGSELYLISRVENDEEQAVNVLPPPPRLRACARRTARPRSA